MKRILFIVVFMQGLTYTLFGQSSKSTVDLSFLIGEWTYTQVYNPGKEDERELTGSLSCQWALDSTFIECAIDLERPGKSRAFVNVFYNYNTIYGAYESVWLSSTWPIKVIMHGDLSDDGTVLTMQSEFPIEEGIIEYVKDEMIVQYPGSDSLSFFRKVFISTSENTEWRHHMNDRGTIRNKNQK